MPSTIPPPTLAAVTTATTQVFNTVNDVISSNGKCNTGTARWSMTPGGTYTTPLNKDLVRISGAGLSSILSLTLNIVLPTTNQSALMDGKEVFYIITVSISVLNVTCGKGDTLADTITLIGAYQRFGFRYNLASQQWERSM